MWVDCGGMWNGGSQPRDRAPPEGHKLKLRAFVAINGQGRKKNNTLSSIFSFFFVLVLLPLWASNCYFVELITTRRHLKHEKGPKCYSDFEGLRAKKVGNH